jgi:hypothetical protein
MAEAFLPTGKAATADEYAGAYVFFATRGDIVPLTGSILNFDGGIGVRGLTESCLGSHLDNHFKQRGNSQ